MVFMHQVADVLLDAIVLGSGNPDHEPAPAENSQPATATANFRVLELVWLFDNFCLRGYELQTQPGRIREQLSAYSHQRMSNDRDAIFTSLGCTPDERESPHEIGPVP
jgi:hypothetical protein